MNWKFSCVIVFILVSLGTSGCVPKPKVLKPAEVKQNRKLAIFFDGTANDESSDTNIRKLHSLVSLQNRKDISTFYVEGVGANGKIIGMSTGWGMGCRAQLAYQYLVENFREGDEIYLFGFSRGAYLARILASMLYYAGLPVSHLPDGLSASAFADLIYDAYKGDMSDKERKAAIEKVLNDNGLPQRKPVNITFMGLWDTVEALGVPDYEENFIVPNGRYGDQLCNVRRAAHALALDDDRARIFTPILLTRHHLLASCNADLEGKDWEADEKNITKRLNEVVDEVWFSGAHADVGGGYLNGLLSGVSLNWMIRKLRGENLLPSAAAVRADPDEYIHDPEAGLWGTIYHKKWRNFIEYAYGTPYNDGRLKVHHSVVARLSKPEMMAPKQRTLRDEQWLLPKFFNECFIKNENEGYDFLPKACCRIEVVDVPPVAIKKMSSILNEPGSK